MKEHEHHCDHADHQGHGEHRHDHHEETFPEVETDTHDSATIGTVRCRIPGEYEEAKDLLKTAMEKTAEDVESSGGMVGHIKAFIREERRNAMISIPEPGDVQIHEGEEPAVYVENANICFGITEETMRNILKKHYGDWL